MESELAHENLELRRDLEQVTLENMALREKNATLAERCRLLQDQVDQATHRIQRLVDELQGSALG